MSEPVDDSKPAHRRRPRYRGTHPRRYEEKYKELAPEAYPELIAHVRARGKTPAGQHVPILVEEVLAALEPRPGKRGVDATLGWGGHARHLLAALSPGGSLLALDADPIELPRGEERLLRLGIPGVTLLARRTNFAGLRAAMDAEGWHDGADFVLADLGVSSMQIDDPARGFSIKLDGPLDMRMNPNRGVSAAQWLGHASLERLTEVLRDHADEPRASRIAAGLMARRGQLATTHQLVAAVRDALGSGVRAEDADLSVRRVFQALRMEVNDEFGTLDALLRQLPGCLRPGGRVAVITFHSGEDRRVKRAFAAGERSGVYAAVARDIVRPSTEERRANPRSSAAKLRWACRAAATVA